MKVREAGRIVSVAVTVAVAVNDQGRREVLGVAIGASEAETFWTEFLRSLARRGLRGVKLLISDDHKGLKAAATRILGATWQRCRRALQTQPAGPCTARLGRSRPIVLDQDFVGRGASDQKWSADISYIWTAEGWLYLAVLIDLFSRRVVGWAVSDRLKKDLALRALRMALVTRHPPSGLIHHSDRGSQYCSIDYQAVLRKHGLLISMSGKGNCYDNAVVETFFKTIKSELIWPVSWQTRSQAENAVARYIDGFYNPIRRHSTLGYQSPVHFEMAGRE